MREFTYHFLDMKTGRRDTAVGKFRDEKHLLQELNKWNKINADLWKYWY